MPTGSENYIENNPLGLSFVIAKVGFLGGVLFEFIWEVLGLNEN